MSFHTDLTAAINRYSRENDSNTPDFLLAMYLEKCLEAYGDIVRRRDDWYGFNPKPGEVTRNITKEGDENG